MICEFAPHTKSALAHAVVGCVSAEMSSGNCGKGALAAAVSDLASPNPLNGSLSIWGAARSTAEAGLVGGVVEKIEGGKFDDGFSIGAAGYLFNAMAHSGGLNGRGCVPQDGDNTLLARLMFAEAAGQPDAYPDVGWSVVNRVADPAFGSTLTDVVYEPNQYDSVGKSLWNMAADPASLTGPNADSYARALGVASGILGGSVPDPTNGSTFFYSGPTPAGWFQRSINSGKLVPTVTVGPFTFLKVNQRQ